MNQVKRALVIGGAGGMGAAGVKSLVKAGWQVTIADLSEPDVDLGSAAFFKTDVSSDADLRAAVEGSVKILGGLDAVWNNAGVCLLGNAETMKVEDFDKSYLVNVRANAILARLVVPHLRTAGGGSILFTASGAGVFIAPGVMPYGVSKAALVAMTRHLALEYGKCGIRVNALCPGWIDTKFNTPSWELFGGRETFLEKVPASIPLGRMGTVEEMGDFVRFILSPEASFMTGQALTMDGGESLRAGATR
ncbi:SDR family oxidoreductase [Paraburkholderia sp. Ac-20340]|uniref:SDR family NAD(P)-dependent oxidoreductase n=1 Tax=Paraburkholderia sp. Ac-20340 TaxID=2703888 RepID=UPI00197F01DD|nr:SDR family oxidoreductase [Paraburkholderia sp. Ac-20340]MBN3853965.1 SDR family oxidoreductase [Paraburkholderia sp. Ac-20340]